MMTPAEQVQERMRINQAMDRVWADQKSVKQAIDSPYTTYEQKITLRVHLAQLEEKWARLCGDDFDILVGINQ